MRARESEKKFMHDEFEKRGFYIVGWGATSARRRSCRSLPGEGAAGSEGSDGPTICQAIRSRRCFFSKIGLKGNPMSIG